MNKHILGYGILVASVAILAGQIVTHKVSERENMSESAIVSKVIEDKQMQKTLDKLRAQIKEKDEYIAELRKTIGDKTSEINALKSNPRLEKIEKLEKKNDIVSLLESTSNVSKTYANKAQRQFTERRFTDLFEKLNLSEENKELLIDLIVEKEAQKRKKVLELFKGHKNGDVLDFESVSSLSDTTEADQQIEELLGYDYATFKRYENTEQERNQLKNITASLEDIDSLSEDQEERLIDIMAERNKARGRGSNIDDETYISEASEFLSGTQTEELRKSFKRNSGRHAFIPNTSLGTNVKVETFTTTTVIEDILPDEN